VLVKEREEIIESVVESVAGFSEATVRALSAARNEPAWMLEFRLSAWSTFEAMAWPKATDEAWRRTRLTGFKLENFQPHALPSGQSGRDALTELLQEELDEMDSAASLIFQDGGVIYRDVNEDLAGKGVIFTDLQTAVLEHGELLQRYFMTEVVKPEHNKFTALHAALWDTGAFVYVPKNTKVELPLQVILNQAADGVGGYHHTLVVVGEGAEVTVVDDLLGGHNGMQSAVVELYQEDNSVLRYMNLQDFEHTT
jgi:Fe-S cluster assembly scaffold protein SufB